MRVLWLTRYLPYPPFFGGDAIYSSKLIEALAGTGADISVLCYAFNQSGGKAPPPPAGAGNIRWTVLDAPHTPIWTTVFSALPSIAARFRSAELRRALNDRLSDGHWDAVIVDHIGMAGAASQIATPNSPGGGAHKLVYLSHNHEASVRALTADEYRGNPVKRIALKREAAKVARLERSLVHRADIVTANTETDAALFRADDANCAPVIVTPGYDGPVIRARTIDERTPRRATLVGSFGWIAKQMNLEAFLQVAAPRFANANSEIEVLGNMPDGYREKIQQRFPSVLVRGRYDDIAPHLADTRLGVVPEQTGGGFKHKVLSYAFGRVPVAALHGSVAGMPLIDGDSILYADGMESLADACLAALDDLALLNRIQENAFDAVEHAFDWAQRGRILADAIAGHGHT